ncbi:MAG: sulfotransferase domain-containing protein [Chloroflexi bacterium]|nr:sulfotransferase domain-containing protein [Chloroflexota bacterium]
MSFPDFLCIGAQKSGTSWLDTNLRYHPDLWLPPTKEIHYFNRGLSPFVAKLFDRNPIKRRLVPSHLKVAFREIIKLRTQPRAALYTAVWYMRFLFSPRSDEWYRALFTPSLEQSTGEVSPGYARLSEEKVMKIRALMPQVKIIYLLRNPVDRIWSHAAMDLSKLKNLELDTIAPELLRQFLCRPGPVRHSSYMETLAIWEKHFPSEQIFIGFFDQISQSPRQLLVELYRFLSVSAQEKYISPDVKEKVGSRTYPEMPSDFRQEITKRLYLEIVSLHKRFDNQYTEYWLNSAKSTLNLTQNHLQ